MLGSHSPRLAISGLVFLSFTFLTPLLPAVEPDEVIINEVYYDNYTKDPGPKHMEAVELLVVKDGVDLNGLLVSDRDVWSAPTEFQCILQDAGQNFLQSVRSGTLLVIYDGEGSDDIDGEDFTLTFYSRSSLFCNVNGKTNAFYLGNYGDNVHLLHENRQVDYIKYRPNDRPERGGDPGNLEWDKGAEGFIDAGAYGENAGVRYMGDKAELNNFPVAWQAYPEAQRETNNLGKPNGGRNTGWIENLRKNATPPRRE